MRFVIAVALAAFAQPALAHGEKAQGAPAYDYSKAEATPFGIAADPAKAARIIRVDMDDSMRFSPAEVTVQRGDVVRFAVANKGQVLHEMVLGTLEELEKHAELMKRFPGMVHDEPHMAHVSPGATGEIGWRFTRPGTFYFGCLIPGHFEAGMIGTIHVTTSRPSKGSKP